MNDQIRNVFVELDTYFARSIAEFEALHQEVAALQLSTAASLKGSRDVPYSREQLAAEQNARADDFAVAHACSELGSLIRTLAHDRTRLADIGYRKVVD